MAGKINNRINQNDQDQMSGAILRKRKSKMTNCDRCYGGINHMSKEVIEKPKPRLYGPDNKELTTRVIGFVVTKKEEK